VSQHVVNESQEKRESDRPIIELQATDGGDLPTQGVVVCQICIKNHFVKSQKHHSASNQGENENDEEREKAELPASVGTLGGCLMHLQNTFWITLQRRLKRITAEVLGAPRHHDLSVAGDIRFVG
jgi:hypothetical protein